VLRCVTVACLGVTAVGCSSSTAIGGTVPASTSTTSTSTTTPAPSSTSSTTTSTTTAPPPTFNTDPAPTADERAVTEQFDARAASLLHDETHAIEVAVARHGTVIAEFAHGPDTTGQHLAPNAPFRLASISKVFASVVVLQLVEEGLLQLDQPFAQQWAGSLSVSDPRVRQITVRQLLQHTSGFGKFRDMFFKNGSTAWHDSADQALAATLDHDPGTFYSYSNANYVVLGRLVEQITGQPYEQAVAARVFTPLGITTARFNVHTADIAPTGPAYVVNHSRHYLEALGPAGDWELSAADTVRVLAALQPTSTTPLLQPSSLAAMHTPSPVFDEEQDWTYGLGLMLFAGFSGHTGTLENVRTFVIDLPNGYTVSVLCATEGVPDGEAMIKEFVAEIALLAALPTAG
jgi:CubicO group peptidase (beta-lactamase class C family)